MSVLDLTFDPPDTPGGSTMVFYPNGYGCCVTYWALDAYQVEEAQGTQDAWEGVGWTPYGDGLLSVAEADEAMAYVEALPA